jgi:hypothetical protein
MVFVYLDDYPCQECRLDLRGETCLKTMFLTRTLGLRRLFIFRQSGVENKFQSCWNAVLALH